MPNIDLDFIAEEPARSGRSEDVPEVVASRAMRFYTLFSEQHPEFAESEPPSPRYEAFFDWVTDRAGIRDNDRRVRIGG